MRMGVELCRKHLWTERSWNCPAWRCTGSGMRKLCFLFWFCPRKQACGHSPLPLSYALWVLTCILCYIMYLGQTRHILSDRALICHLWAVIGPAVKEANWNKNSQVLACSVTAQGPIPSAWPTQMWLGLWCRAAELVWVWDGQWATQNPGGEYYPLFLCRSNAQHHGASKKTSPSLLLSWWDTYLLSLISVGWTIIFLVKVSFLDQPLWW